MEWIGYESVLIVFTPALLLFLINYIYHNIRRKFNFKVNCWFCNENTRVPYAEINAFMCPSCTQYNGFNKDGSYNKQILEQHDEMLNAQYHSTSINESCSNHTPSNGLCKFCNNNQQLKIYQLAHFVPMDEENYDIEIEHFQKQLEKAYKLCPKCDRVLKKTLGQQNKWMLGLKLASLKKKVAVINETIITVQAGNRHWLLTGFLRLLLLFYFVAVMMVTSKYSKQLSEYLPEALKPLNYDWIIKYGSFNYFRDNYMPVLAITGILLSLTLFMTNRKSKINKKTEVPLSPKKLCKVLETEQQEAMDFPLNSTDLSSDPESDYESFNASIRKRQMKKAKKRHNTTTNQLKPLVNNSMLFQTMPQTTFESLNRSKSPSNNSTFNLPELFAEVI
ncbi:PREDICTED: uncharacterized protein LOC108568969 isoform X2 [Nicrophorus vespilloides]|uniref:Uncharacterized protein LOC108568969 isoform X2 n=1 Tax=Nicrophorus vespilloides TaxID=110193 RepID=A0ABM1NG62_NICVS|nr:PREDICTED: uncharacterized protein LOC108568969 isoform X2 [Nicrophorus vespilloides]